MPATVVLEHCLPDGTSHFDWMIERPGLRSELRLATWRTAIRPDRAEPGEPFVGERIGDHRAHYLGYEGPLSGDRGSVRRVGAGSVEWAESRSGSVGIRVRWAGGGSGSYTGRLTDGGGWLWRLDPA